MKSPLTQKRSSGFRQGIVFGGDDLAGWQGPDGDNGDQHIQHDHKNHCRIERAGQDFGGVAYILGAIGDQFKSFVGQEDQHSAGDDMQRIRPRARRQARTIDAADAHGNEQDQDHQLDQDNPIFRVTNGAGAEQVEAGDNDQTQADEQMF